MTPIYVTVPELTARIEHVGQMLFMDSFFPSPDLYDDLLTYLLFWY
jgi:hypothetical protein